MSREDMCLSVVLSLVVLGMFVICYNKVFAVTFDESFAKATGVRVSAYNLLIAVLTAITIILGLRSRYENDGCHADLEPCDLPGTDIHAGI